MKSLKHSLALALTVAAFGLTANNVVAQGQRGNFDPEQMRQRMEERIREQFDIKSDEDWKAIEPRVTKVSELRRQVMAFGGGGFGGMRGGGGRRGGDAAAGNGGNGGNADRGNRPRGGFFGEPAPESEALSKAIEAKASADEIKSKLAKFREARKAKETELEKAQEDLKKVLTVKQEAAAVMLGLLK